HRRQGLRHLDAQGAGLESADLQSQWSDPLNLKEPLNNSVMSLRSLSRVAARRQAQLIAVALSKSDNEAAARDRLALRGLQAKALTALHFLDRPTHAFESASCQHLCLKARDITELFRGSFRTPVPDR